MLLRIFKYNATAGYLLIPLLTVIAWWPSLVSGSYQQMAFDLNPMPLYKLITGYFPHHSITSNIIAMLLVILAGFYLIRLNNKYLFIRDRTLLPPFFFIVIVSSLTPLHRLNPAIIAMLFLFSAVDRLLASYKTERLSYSYFEAPFLIGVGSLFYFNLIWFVILVWAALLILRPVIWREWVFSILGLATPWVFFLAIDYFMHDSLEWSIGAIAGNFVTRDAFTFIFLQEKIFLSFLLLLILFASRRIIRSMPAMKVLLRKIFLLFFWIFAISMATFFVFKSANIELAFLAAMPVAFLLSHYILSKGKGFWPNVILWSIVAGMLILAWLPVIIMKTNSL